jgi:DNA repair exonuclease SbcCD ATPase subunit
VKAKTVETLNQFYPEHVTIKNFNNIRDLSMNISNITVVTGKNGSGKTSVAEAIGFCLTGDIMRDVAVTDVITTGEDESIVSIRGKYNNAPVEITRKRTKRSQDVKIITGTGNDAKEIENPKEFLEGIVTSLEFYRMFYINGHDIDSFLAGTTAKASEMLDKLFSIESLDTIIKESSRAATDLMKNIEITRATVETLVKKKELTESIKNSAIDKVALRAEMEAGKKQITELEKTIDENEAKNIDQKLAKADAEISKMAADWNRFTDFRSRKESSESVLDQARKNKKDIDDQIAAMVVISDEERENEIVKMKSEIASIDAEIASWKEMPGLLDQVLSRSKDSEDCPLCLSPGKRDDAMKNMASLNEGKKNRLPKILTRKMELKNKIAAMDQASALVREITNARSRTEGQIGELQRSINLMVASGSYTEMPHDTPETLRQLKANRDAINIEIRAMIAKNSSTTERIHNLKSRVENIGVELARETSPVTWNDVDENEIANARQEIERKTAKMDVLVGLKNGFKKVLSGIRESIMATINPGIMTYISKLGKGESAITGFEIVPQVKRRGNDQYYYYDIKVAVNKAEMQFNSLSTGQRALALVSVILNVINMSRCSLSMIIFDEIDNCGLDHDYINAILKAIVNLSSSMKIIFIDRNQETIDALKTIGAEKSVPVTINVMRPASRGE